ncbi:MAG: hypothetical protein FWG42_08095, partial [Clostridiales bacterium]|nr:hypothetical protein [Clostridiales bacterium]
MRKRTKIWKFALCWALVLGLVCSTGALTFAGNDFPDEGGGTAFVLSDDMEYIVATPEIYSALAVSNPAYVDIKNVEVLTGGSSQVLYRSEVYKGVVENSEDPAKYYTTRREINLKDPRIFNIEFYLPLDEVATDGITPLTADEMTAFLNTVNFKYGGFDLSEWKNGNTLRGTGNGISGTFPSASIMSMIDRTMVTVVDLSNPISPVAGYMLAASIRVTCPWTTVNSGTNVPYANYASAGQGNFNPTNTTQSGDNRDWWQAGPAYKGTGMYELEAFAGNELLATTDLHIGPYDEHYSWIEMNEFAQSLITAINGKPLAIEDLNKKPTGLIAAGYVAKAGDGYRGGYVKGDRATDVYVEVSIMGYGMTDNYKPENTGFNNYARFNAMWNVVVAKDESKVDDYLKPGGVKDQMNNDPAALMAKYRDAKDEDIDFLGVYYQDNVHSDEVTGTETMIKLIDDLITGGKAGQKIHYKTYAMDDVNLRYRLPAPGYTASTSSHQLKGGYTGRFLEADSRKDAIFDTGAMLDSFIFVQSLCCNPDGKAGMRRTNRYGLDMNRDVVYATQSENIALTNDYAKWDPFLVTQWHGYVTQMLIDPCTAPHAMTFEYDLLMTNELALAYQAGYAILGSTGYSDFRVPWDQMTNGAWDDGSAIYGPMYPRLFGALGYTVETPHGNLDSFEAMNVVNYAFLNGMLYGETQYFEGNLLNHPMIDTEGKMRNGYDEDIKYTSMRKSTVMNKLESKVRGIENIDSMNCDKYFIDYRNGVDLVVGRPRVGDGEGGKLNFFPDYIIIPTDPGNQYNTAEAIKILNHVMRVNGKVSVSTKDVVYQDVLYPAGSYVINMRQSFRNLVFEIMGKGYDATFFPSSYADIYCNFPDVRGFDSVQVWNKLNGGVDLFAGALEPVAARIAKYFDIGGTADDYVVFKSSSTDAIRFVNLLLSGRSSGPSFSEKGDVWMLRKAVDGVGSASDYVIKAEDIDKVGNLVDNPDLGLSGCHLEGKYISELPKDAVQLVEPIITTNATRTAQTGGNIYWALDEYLGFNMVNADGSDYNGNSTTTTRPGANVVLLHGNSGTTQLRDYVAANKAGVILISNASSNTASTASSPFLSQFGFTSPTTGSLADVALNGNYNADDSLFTQNYAATDTLYARGNYFTNVPAAAKVLFTSLPDGNDAFIGGWMNTGGAKTTFANRTMIFSTILKGGGIVGKPVQSLTIGQGMFYRSHYQKLYPMMATAIFAGAAGILDDFAAPKLNDVEVDSYAGGTSVTLVAEDDPKGSGIEKFELSKWDGSGYAFVGEQASPAFDFPGLTTFAVFKVTITDWAGNDRTRWFDTDGNIYCKDPMGGILRLSVFGEETGYINQDVEFTIAARNASDILTVNVTFEIDGSLLAFKSIEGLNGFDMINGVSWRSMGGDVWRGTITLGYPDTGTETGTGFTNASYTDIGKLTFAPRAAGDVSVTLVKIDRVTGKAGLDVVDVDAIIENG